MVVFYVMYYQFLLRYHDVESEPGNYKLTKSKPGVIFKAGFPPPPVLFFPSLLLLLPLHFMYICICIYVWV